jgi:RNA polymerase sigma-70 factor (ECF subfamily)
MNEQPVATDLKEWFVRTYEQSAHRLYLVAYQILRNADDARDAAQEAALRVYGRLPKMADRSSLDGYLVTATRNVALDMVKRAYRSKEKEAVAEPVAPRREHPGGDELDQLGQAFQHLPLGYREVLYLRYREALDAKQIAARLGISHANARARLSRAHKSLKLEMGVAS